MARPVDPEPLEGPVRFGPYTLVRRIGAGGMGEVFLAREEAVRRACVVKKVLPQLMASPQFAGRFRDEARVVVRLAHPNIARVYAMGEVDEQLYLAMEYVQGKTLSRLAYRLRQLGKTVPLGVLLHLGERLCEGLAYAHEAKDEHGHPLHLVHRDLSPANVCISYAGEVKIIDFGAAQSTLKQQETQPRVVIGNLTYMAPEQARKRFVDRRADLYALGVLLWELTAWRPLPQRGDPVERWRRAAYPEWEPAGNYRKGVPQALDALLMRALAPEPAARFPDAVAMGAELARLKAKLTPNCAGDADLARLMESAFPREKVMEEAVLRELLAEAPPRRRTSQEVAVLAPPTALAFEHSGIETPEGFVPPARSRTALFGAVDAEQDGEVTVPLGRPRAAEPEVTVPEGRPGGEAAEDGEATVPAARKPGFPAHAQAGRPGIAADGGPTVPMAAQGLGADGEATVPPGVRHADAETTMPLAAWGAGGARSSTADEATRPLDAWRLDNDGEATVPPATLAAPVSSEVTVPPAARAASVSSETTVPPAARAASLSGEVTVPPASRPGAAAGRPGVAADNAATEALEASKVLVAIARSEASRSSGPKPVPQRTRTADTVTPVMAPRPLAARASSRMVPRETQVGFGLDISQTVDAEAVEARRIELVRAITGDGDAPALSPWRVALHGRRAWAAGLLCACAVGLGVAWALAGR